jgi:hypothetical protein
VIYLSLGGDDFVRETNHLGSYQVKFTVRFYPAATGTSGSG